MADLPCAFKLEQISAILNENSLRLSRTRNGVSDTSASPLKRPLVLSGEALRKRSAQNELSVHALIFQMRAAAPPASEREVRDLLFQIADLTNDGLLPAGRLRMWDIDGKTPPGRLEGEIDAFCAAVFDRWGELKGDAAPLAAWAEWELCGGPLHPFYDGCGRISRSFAAALLLRGGSLPPLYGTLSEYFERGNRGNGASHGLPRPA